MIKLGPMQILGGRRMKQSPCLIGNPKFDTHVQIPLDQQHKHFAPQNSKSISDAASS